MKKAFTLIELLVIIAIMGTMVTVGVMSFTSGRTATSTFAAARDVMAMVRRARSTALIMQKPTVLIYSNGKSEETDDVAASVELKADKFFSSKRETRAIENLAGDVLVEAPNDAAAAQTKDKRKTAQGEGTTNALNDENSGETIEDVLAPTAISSEVMSGLKIKVLEIDETLVIPESETRKSKISIFSTAGAVARSYELTSSTKKTEDAASEGADEGTEETKEIVFNANGTVTPPHKIWLYPDGSTPDKGLCIEVDRYGEPKCEGLDGL